MNILLAAPLFTKVHRRGIILGIPLDGSRITIMFAHTLQMLLVCGVIVCKFHNGGGDTSRRGETRDHE